MKRICPESSCAGAWPGRSDRPGLPFLPSICRIATILLLACAPSFAGAETPTSTASSPASAKASRPQPAKSDATKPADASEAATPVDGAPLDLIRATKDENGRTVYINADAPKPPRATSARKPGQVYWSTKEKRWKPAPAPSPSAMRAARNAAQEVVRYMESGSPAESSPTAADAKTPPPAELSPVKRSYTADVMAELGRLTGAPASHVDSEREWVRGRTVSTAEIDAAIEEAAARHQVDANLVRAIIKVESNFNPQAISRKGAMGLMQLMPDTARQLNVSNPFDPQQNVDAGVRHLRSLMNNFGGDLKLSLAAYNAGENAVIRSNGVPNYSETRNYVKQITNLYWMGDPATHTLWRPGATPIRVFRNQNGVLTITNE